MPQTDFRDSLALSLFRASLVARLVELVGISPSEAADRVEASLPVLFPEDFPRPAA